ncbi:MAG: MotA/TolQ/ExbB proton channel family protein [Pseudomonadota bacterium]
MKYTLIEIFERIRDFLEVGGPVLLVILFTAVLMWTIIIERYWFVRITYPRLVKKAVVEWNTRSDTSSWYACQIREQLISRISVQLNRSLIMLQTLVALCPLLGLLGTVFGMIHVFDTMAITGSSNARLMAAGISMATIPTMAGMVTALSGLYFSARLKHHATFMTQLVADQLTIQDTRLRISR